VIFARIYTSLIDGDSWAGMERSTRRLAQREMLLLLPGNGNDFFCVFCCHWEKSQQNSFCFQLFLLLSAHARIRPPLFYFSKGNFLSSHWTMNRWLFAAQGETCETWNGSRPSLKACTFYCVNRSIQCV
jgi:hypothetical protein